MALITEDVELEYSVLFSVLKYGTDALRDIKSLVEDKDFTVVENRKIYSKLIDIYSSTGSLPSHHGFFKLLLSEEQSDDDKVKLKLCLKKITKAVIEQKDAIQICKKIREYRCIREMLKMFNNTVRNAESQNIDSLLTDVLKGINDIRTLKEQTIFRGVMGIIEMLEQRKEYVTDVKQNPTKNGLVKTGFKWIDSHIPPHSPGSMIIYQARTNTGKSMFLMATALHNWLAGLKVIIITIEMNEYDYAFRIDSNVTTFKHEEFASGDISDDTIKMTKWEQKIKSCDKGQGDLYVYWVPERCTPDKIESIITNHPFKPDLVVVDYAGDMKAGLRGIPDYSPAAQGEIYSRLKEIAGKFRCVLYTAQQTKRGVKSIDTESGSWSDIASYKADIMIAIEKTKDDELERIKDPVYGNECDRMTVRLVKGRNVPKVMTRLYERFARMSWFEVEEDPNYSYKKDDKKAEEETKAEFANGEAPEQIIEDIIKDEEPKNNIQEEEIDFASLDNM